MDLLCGHDCSPHSVSPKLLWIRSASAAIAASSSAPSAVMRIWSFILTPAESTLKMLLALTGFMPRVRFSTVMREENPPAALMNSAAGRACSPTLLCTTTSLDLAITLSLRKTSHPCSCTYRLCRHRDDLLHAQALLKPWIVGLASELFGEKIGEGRDVEAHPADRHIRAWNDCRLPSCHQRHRGNSDPCHSSAATHHFHISQRSHC